MGLVFVSIRPVSVFWLENLIYLYLRQYLYVCAYYFVVFVGLFSSLILFSYDLTFILSVVFAFLCVCVCVWIVDFWFVVPMRFWYRSLCIYKIVLSCWFLNFQCISNILHLYSPHDCWFWYICVWMISSLYVCFSRGAFPFVIFLFVSSCGLFFPPKVPLGFVVKLVWWCWILSFCL